MAEPRHRGARLVVRRALVQWPLLLAVLAVMVCSSALVGTGTLLIGEGQTRALAAAAERADGARAGADLVTVTAGVNDASGTTPPPAATTVAGLLPLLQHAAAPFAVHTSVWAASPPMSVPGDVGRRTYLLDADTAEAHATLTQGRWPRTTPAGDAIEVVLPRTAAIPLGLGVGSRVSLEASAEQGTSTQLVVVGLADLDGSSTWQRDIIGGAGVSTSGWLPLYGPCLVAPGSLLAADAPAGFLNVVADLDLSGDPTALAGTGRALDALRNDVHAELGDRVDFATVRSGLSAFVAAARHQLALTASIVVFVVLLVATLAAAALVLLARLIAARRRSDTMLATERGASRLQHARWAAAEGFALAVLATALGVPLALAGYRVLLAVPPLADSWRLATPVPQPGVGAGLVAVVAAGAVTQALVAMAPALREGAAPVVRGRSAIGEVSRSGVDVLLAALAVLAYLQLRAHRAALDGPDPVLAAAPVLCLVAGAALALRVLPVVVRLAESLARRSTGLVGPLAGWQVARARGSAGIFLAVLATAVGTFGLAYQATWTTSQHDQADAAVGADVAVVSDGSVGQGAALAAAMAATGATGSVLPVTDRPVGLGSRPGATLVSLYTRRAEEVLRGRVTGGRSWGRLAAGLAPTPLDALSVDGTSITAQVTAAMTGGGVPGSHVTPTVVVQDSTGQRVPLSLGAVPADGQPHEVTAPSPGSPPLPQGRWQVVAVHLALTAPSAEPDGAAAMLDVAVRLIGATPPPSGSATAWSAGAHSDMVMAAPSVELVGDTVTTRAPVSLLGLSYAGAQLVVTAFPVPEKLPVLVSSTLADSLGLAPGDVLDLTMAGSPVPATVSGVAPYIPSAPGQAAILADADALSRSLLATGDMESLTDAWWITTDEPTLVGRAVDGRSRTALADDQVGGPLRAASSVVLDLLVVAAVLLAVTGAAARESAAGHERAVEASRLRGFGVPRRMILATSVVRHTLMSVGVVTAGVAVGVLLAHILGPPLVVSPEGGVAIPAALVTWPWPGELAVLAALLVGSVAAGVPAARTAVGRAASVGLRMGDAP